MALKGELGEFSVEQILRLLELSAQTGTLDVRTADARASIDVDAGTVANVRGDDDPEVALGRVLGPREGTFSFRPGPSSERVLDAPLDELLERARARAAAADEVRSVVPDEDARFTLSGRAMSGASFTVAPDELKVLMEIGGGRSAREIRQHAKTTKAQTASLLYALVQKGLIERAPAEAPPPGPVAPQRARPKLKPAAASAAAKVDAVATEPAPAPIAAEPPPMEIAAAASAPAAEPADVTASELGDELDARLAALSAYSDPVASTPPAAQTDAHADGVDEPPEAVETPSAPEPRGELVVVTPTGADPSAASDAEATVVFSLHYMPPTAAAAVETPAPAPAPKRRGLFDFVLRRGAATKAAEPDIDIPSAADLAALANELFTEFERQADARSQLGSFAERATARSFGTIPARLSRVYAMRAVGSRVPLRGDRIDVDAVREVPPAGVLPYLALLVRSMRDEAMKMFGADAARATYESTAARVFGKKVATPTMVIRRADVPQRGRLTVRGGGSAGPFDLREGTYTIGRAKECEIAINDMSVSSHHGRIVSGLAGYTLTDLGSTNGTKVNGSRIAGPRVLRSGDVLRLGDVELLFEQQTPGS